MQTTTQLSTSIYSKMLDQVLPVFEAGHHELGISKLMVSLKKILDTKGDHYIFNDFKIECIDHPLFIQIMEDPCTRRSFEKPKGYAGDAGLIDMIYRYDNGGVTSFEGRKIMEANVNSSVAESVRWRAHHLANKIEEVYQNKQDKITVLSIASGRCRELAYVENPESKISGYVCLDQDEESNEIVRKSYPYPFLHVLDESIMYIIKGGFSEQRIDFVYSAGLFDYLNDKLASKLINKLYNSVSSGGTLLIPNFAPGLLEQGYMETFMDWKLIYRNEEQMIQLALDAGIDINNIHLYRDPMFNVIYMEMRKG